MRRLRRAWAGTSRRDRRLALAAVGLLALLVAVAVVTHGRSQRHPTPVTLSTALHDIRSGAAATAVLDDGTRSVTLTMAAGHRARLDPDLLDGAGLPQAPRGTPFDARREIATYPTGFGQDLATALLAAKVPTTAAAPRDGGMVPGLVAGLLVVALVIALLVWTSKGGAAPGAVGRFAGTRGKEISEVPDVRFADVAGVDEAVGELAEIVEFLKDPARFEKVGARRPAGALLVGPPGTGKTLLARAVAGEAGCRFLAVAGSDFVETYVGVGARRVRDLFDRAKNGGPAIVFIDEIDAVGRVRGGGTAGNGGTDERENTLIALLNELDGFVEAQDVVVLAATNRADVLDPALKRPGRLDREVAVPLPDRRGRERILAVHARTKPVAPDVDLTTMARRTPGFSGAELEQLVNEACLEAARRERDSVDAACFETAVATVAMGRARTSALVTDSDRELTAWHEAGHTLAAALLPDADDPVSVTIVPRGPAGGVTWMAGSDDVYLTRSKALAQLTVALAGRAGEQALLDGQYTQGAAGDLETATRLATAMVTQYGMTEFGLAQVDPDLLRVGGELAVSVHRCVDQLLRDAHARATTLLSQNRGALASLATALLDEETLPAPRISEIVGVSR